MDQTDVATTAPGGQGELDPFTAALAQFEVTGYAKDLTGGTDLERNKDALIGVPFVVLTWTDRPSDRFYTRDPQTGLEVLAEYLSITVMTRDGRRVVFNDSGTGIRPVLQAWYEKSKQQGGLIAKNGLRRSDYEYNTEAGKVLAHTYYLD